MSLPYRWRPIGTKSIGYTKSLKPGMIVPFEHAVYRLIDVRPYPDNPDRPFAIALRPIEVTTDDPRARDHDQHFAVSENYWWDIYESEHYPVCVKCQEPLPCREQMAAQVAEQAAEHVERYSTAGVCPACEEPVTQRQKSKTWDDNVVAMFGPPVTFHLRNNCWTGAMRYEQRWQAADPDNRRTTLSCVGEVTCHFDGTSDCTETPCPGPRAYHPHRMNHYPRYTDCPCVASATPPSQEQPFSPDEVRRVLGGGS